MLPASCYLLPATGYLLPATCHLPPAPFYLLLLLAILPPNSYQVTKPLTSRRGCHLLPTTYFLLPTAYRLQAGLPLMRTRLYPHLEPVNMRAPWLYEVDDLISLIAATPHPNHSGGDSAGAQGWSLLNLQLNVPGHAELQQRYSELSPQERQCGL